MLYLFIAVMAVLVIMNIFMLFVLRQMAGATGRQIEKDAGRLFGVYEELLEEKSRELEELSRQEEELKSRMAVSAVPVSGAPRASQPMPSPNVKPASFRDKDFAGMYNQVKRSFSMAEEEFAGEFLRSMPEETEGERRYRELLTELRELLSFENLYRISILPGAQQSELLSQVMTKEQAGVCAQWREETGGGSVTELSDWLDEKLAALDARLTVKTSRLPEGWASGQAASAESAQASGQAAAALAPAASQPSIRWQADPAICEGVKIIYKNRLYDYSI